MSRLISDGFEAYTSIVNLNEILGQWTGVTNPGSFGVTSDVNSRFANAKYVYYLGGDAYAWKSVGNQSRLIAGLAARGPGGITNGNSTVFGFSDWTSTLTWQCVCTINTDGSVSVRRGGLGGTAVATSAPGLVVPTLWDYWEFDITFHSSAGAVQIWKNGVSVANVTGVNTSQTGNAYANTFHAGAVNGSPNVGFTYIDDVYCLNTAGSGPWSGRLGDLRMFGVRGNAAGSSAQFLRSTGSNNYQNVNDFYSNEDSGYNYSNTVGDTDLHAMDDLPTGWLGNIFGVVHYSRARKDDAGTRQYQQALKIGGSTVLSTNIGLNTSYLTSVQFQELSPATGVMITPAEANGMEAGVKLAA